MSRLSDYSKFDHLDDDDYDDDNIDNGTRTGGYDTTISDITTSVPIHEIVSPVIHNNNHNSNINYSDGTIGSLKVGPSVRIKEMQKKSNDSSSCSSSSSINLQQQQQQQQQNRYRFIYEYNGQPIYEWEQGLSEVLIYVYCPTNRKYHSSDFICTIHPSLIQLGLKGSSTNNTINTNIQYFIDEQTYEKVDVHESTWTIEEMEEDDDELNNSNNKNSLKKQCIVFYLQKVAKGIVWKAALRGQPVPPTSATGTNTGSTVTSTSTTINTNTTTMIELDLYTYQLVQQQVLKERWQEENPSMDFSSATFNGSVPDPRSFMGGVRY